MLQTRHNHRSKLNVRFEPLAAGSATIRLRKLDQIPTVSPRILPDCDTPVRFGAGFAFKDDTLGLHTRMVRFKIGCLEEQPDPTTALLSNRCALAFPDRTSQKQFGFPAPWCNPNPTLSVPKVSVFTALEANAQEKCEGFIVFRNEEREEGNTNGHEKVLAIHR
jgi:hypothetical protein